MPLPITIPNTFANATATIPLSQLDNNFATVAVAVNSIGNGAFTLANAQITGGTISNVTLDNVSVDVETLSNVTITNLTVNGNATLTNAAVTANVATITTANTTDVTASNSAVISVNTSGNALRITQTGAGNALVVEDSANPDASPFVIDAGGNVISGYTTTVSVSGGTRPLTVNGAGQILVRATNDTVGATLNFGKTRSTSLASNTIVQSGDELGAIYFAGNDGTDINTNGASIRAEVDGTPGTNDMPGRLVFSTTADGASTPTERMRIDSTGALVLSANSNGITFPATQVANANANTLDDYEEGTFTPGITFGGNDVSLTYSTRTGKHTKIGNVVYYSINIKLLNKGSSTGNALITGLPFTVSNSAAADFCNSVPRAVSALTFTAPLYSQSTRNSTTVGLLDNNLGTQRVLTDTAFTNSTELNISGFYYV